MNKYGLEVLSLLAIVLFCLSTCCFFFMPKADNHKKIKMDFSYEKIVRIVAILLLAVMLILLFASYPYFVIACFAFISIPICLLVVMFVFGIVIRLAFSTDNLAFSPIEYNSLILVGVLLGLIGTISFNEFGIGNPNMWILIPVASLFECVILLCCYSVYIFLIITLLVYALKNAAKKIEIYTGKLVDISTVNYRSYKCSSLEINWDDKYKRRNTIWGNIRRLPLGKRILMIPSLSCVFVLDVLAYIFSNIIYEFLCVIGFSFWKLIYLISNIIRKAAKQMTQLSDHRITTIVFRLSIVASLLTVVILNRMATILHTDDATAILEYISSVVIMPIVFEWIHEILSAPTPVSEEHIYSNK